MTSRMRSEALQAPEVVARLLTSDRDTIAALAAHLREQPPRGVLTVARGSSDHAAHYMAYLAMARLGEIVTSLPMSLVTLYAAKLRREGLVSVAFSQSGQSPDLVAPTKYFSEGGATTVAVVNDAASPLAQVARWVLPLHAGPETSVAATKSYIAQLVTGARLVAAWQQDAELGAALDALPAVLQQAALADWSPAVDVLQRADRLFVIGRGPALAVAMECALKLKEICGMQAEAFSGAEVKHGPMALVEDGYPMLVLAPRGPAQAGLLALAAEMRGRGARVLVAAPAGTPGAELPLLPAGSEDLDAISVVQSFYPMVDALAHARGQDPDQPRHLSKVTRTH